MGRQSYPAASKQAERVVCVVNLMVKLLRACVRMPRRTKAMKDVVSCDKPRGEANILRSGDFRMGEPNLMNSDYSVVNT